MEILSEALQKYVEEHSTGEGVILQELTRDTYTKVLMPGMISGHLQGRVLSMFSHMIRPKNILEIGTFTGYSAICLSEGLQQGGKVLTIDINEELEDMVRQYFDKANVSDKIDYRIANAMELVPTLDMEFDIVFIDADKKNYTNYYDMVIDKISSGGYIIADNVLWKGKVANQENVTKDTQVLLDFNAKVHNDPRVENVLLPIRDGLMVMRKL